MLTIDLFEQVSRPVTVCFGRMNPPTLGHGQLLKTVADNAANGDYYIFATKTHKLPDNPLSYDVKFKFLQAMFPEYANNMVYNPELKTIMQVAQWLYSQGYTELNFVAGSDRLPEFEKLLKAYNGKGQPGDKGYYIFTNINMISAGDRDPDAEGLSGISASKARAAAAAGNFEDFVAKTGAGELARPLYDAVREAMNVSEDIAADSESTTSPIHDGNIEEEAAGVGVVATNKKMARDPRYSMSITKDVKPSTPKNMLRAFRLSESKQAESASIPMIKKFLPIAKKELKLDKLPKIRIQRHVEVHDGQATFGRFVNGEQTIYVGIADRHPVDVLRTLAHELVHWKQFLEGRIEPGSGETGSPIENEANAIAGVLMRHFNKKYPDAVKMDNIELMEDYVEVYSDIWTATRGLAPTKKIVLTVAGKFARVNRDDPRPEIVINNDYYTQQKILNKKILQLREKLQAMPIETDDQKKYYRETKKIYQQTKEQLETFRKTNKSFLFKDAITESQDYVTGQISYSQTLNPVAWEGDALKPKVRDRLLKISGEFVKYLEVPGFEVLDVVLTGSMANYNWTKYSDFDLHVVTNYSDLECEDLAETFYRAKKELWNNYHDITIGGHEVEMYVEDAAKPPVSAGIFSILDNRWVKKPEYNKPEFDKSAINAKVTDLRQQIKSAIESADNITDIQRIKDKLRRMRRAGLDAGGEFSVENLSYKILRNMGILNKMSDIQTKAQDKKLSLPEDIANNGAKLVIFDIDDTLVNTDTRVNVVRDGNVVKTLNSQEFTHYKLKPGEQFDFGRFRDAEEFARTAKPILPMINQLNKDIATGNKVVMVTARADFNDKDKFLNTFRDLGVDIDGVDHVYRSGNIQDKIPTEAKKRRVIANLLSKNLYDKAIMYDDAIPNLDAFLSLRQDFPHTDFYAWHVDHDGGASEYHKTTYKEEFQKKNKLNEKIRSKKINARHGDVAETTTLKLSPTSQQAKSWIEKVYDKFPDTFQGNHVMSWGEGEAQQLAMFELVPSMSKRNAVDIKWFQAYPLRQGIGSRAMRVLQDMAREDGISLTLYPWDKGQISQAKLIKFYKSHGFKPTIKGSKNMVWEPVNEQGVAEGATQKQGQVRQTLNAWMNKDQQYKDPTQREGFQAKVWPYIQKNIKTILADKGEKGNGDYPAAPYAAWLLVQHMDAYPQNQIEFYNALKQAIPDHPKIQFLRDRAAVNQWIMKNANNPKYFINGKALPNPTVNVRNPAIFKDAGIVATSREEALSNAEQAGNKLLVAAVTATNAQTQPSYEQSANQDQQGVAEGLSWSTLDEGLSLEDKMTIFEEYAINGLDAARNYLQKLIKQNMFDNGFESGSMAEAWSEKYKRSINCNRPRGFSQRAHCQGRKKK